MDSEAKVMTEERKKAIQEWLDAHCRKCVNNDDRGTDFVNCQAECEVQKDVGIACIHYEEAFDIKEPVRDSDGV